MTDLQKMELWLKNQGYEVIVLADYMIATERVKRRAFTTFTSEPYIYLQVGLTDMKFRFDAKGRLKGLTT